MQHERMIRLAGFLIATSAMAACGNSTVAGPEPTEPTATVDDVLADDSLDGLDVDDENLRGIDRDRIIEALQVLRGGLIFHFEKFRGNGRTCATCHRGESFDLKPADVQRLHARRPNDPLFLADGSDDGLGNGATRIKEDATIRITFNLPPNITIVEDPSIRQVTMVRAVPSLLNITKLETIFMLDGRQTNLQSQALGAVNDHAQPGRQPTQSELDALALFQQKDPHFYTTRELYEYSRGGPPPTIPAGNTESERRGRAFFEPDTACGSCHFGPMLNESTAGRLGAVFNFGNGTRIRGIRVPTDNVAGLPMLTYRCTNPTTGVVTNTRTADPGRALATGICSDVNQFRTSTLWGINESAPYFHNNSAATLEEVMDQYDRFFQFVATQRGVDLRITPQDREDIIAFMRLL